MVTCPGSPHPKWISKLDSAAGNDPKDALCPIGTFMLVGGNSGFEIKHWSQPNMALHHGIGHGIVPRNHGQILFLSTHMSESHLFAWDAGWQLRGSQRINNGVVDSRPRSLGDAIPSSHWIPGNDTGHGTAVGPWVRWLADTASRRAGRLAGKPSPSSPQL